MTSGARSVLQAGRSWQRCLGGDQSPSPRSRTPFRLPPRTLSCETHRWPAGLRTRTASTVGLPTTSRTDCQRVAAGRARRPPGNMLEAFGSSSTAMHHTKKTNSGATMALVDSELTVTSLLRTVATWETTNG